MVHPTPTLSAPALSYRVLIIALSIVIIGKLPSEKCSSTPLGVLESVGLNVVYMIDLIDSHGSRAWDCVENVMAYLDLVHDSPMSTRSAETPHGWAGDYSRNNSVRPQGNLRWCRDMIS